MIASKVPFLEEYGRNVKELRILSKTHKQMRNIKGKIN